jgi:hypothetical protein
VLILTLSIGTSQVEPCHPCPAGTYNGLSSATECTACPEGRTSPIESTSIASCWTTESLTCTGNINTEMDVACPLGTSLVANSSAVESTDVSTCCELCPVGTFTQGSMIRGGDPCSGPVHVTDGAILSMPAGYAAGQTCDWELECADGPVQLSFSLFSLESDWDFLHVFDSSRPIGDLLIDSLTGTSVPSGRVSTGSSMYVQFTSDQSVSAGGFSAVVSCSGGSLLAPCEPCSPGQYDHDNDPATPCSECSEGQVSIDAGSASCADCPAGSYAQAGSAACTDCMPGLFDHDSEQETATFAMEWRAGNYTWIPITVESPETCATEDLVLDWTVSACSIISLCAAVIMSNDTV